MGNYFISKEGPFTRYIVPEITVLSNTSPRDNLVDHINDDNNPINMDAFRATAKFNPYTIRVSHPMAIDAFVLGSTDIFYKVIEGYYCVEYGTLKLKVKTKYGR